MISIVSTVAKVQEDKSQNFVVGSTWLVTVHQAVHDHIIIALMI
jgi:hypothetical protein